MGQRIEAAQCARHRARHPEQQFQCLQRLQRAHHPHQRASDAAGLAAFPDLGIQRIEAGVAGVIAAGAHHQLPLPAHCGGTDPGLALGHAGGVDGLAGGEVVAAVDHQIHLGHKLRQAGGIESLIDGNQLHQRVVGGQALAGQLRLGVVDRLAIEQDLARQVAGIHRVAIGQPQGAHPGPGQIEGERRAEPAEAHDQHGLILQPRLTGFPHFRQHQLAAVSQILFVTKRSGIRAHVLPPVSRRPSAVHPPPPRQRAAARSRPASHRSP